MLDPIITNAFMYGILSALSLPLGALTSLFWKPDDKAIAFLMAFGGGALLAALTLDLVAGSVANGNYNSLAIGCICGGVLFIVLNDVINDFGGFLRKASTTVYHLRNQEYRKSRQVLSVVRRADVFNDLSDKNYKVLAHAIHNRSIKKGGIIFNKGDSPDNLYIIASGSVSLLDPLEKIPTTIFAKNDDLGWLAFLTGVPYRFTARATEPVSLWVLPKKVFFTLLPESPILAREVQRWIRNQEVADYLSTSHGLSHKAVQLWQDKAIHSLLRRGMYSSALNIDQKSQGFRKIANELIDFDLFNSLPAEEIEAISDRLVYKKYSKEESFYFRGEEADNMYIIEQGHVSMLDALERHRHAFNLTERYVFGYMPFLTGGNYTMATMALEETSVWVLHKKDFNDLLSALPELRLRYREFLMQQKVVDYLINRQQISRNDTMKWVKRSLLQLKKSRTIQAVNTIGFDVNGHKGAPLGIWLGLFLDSIPEALVIGASVAQAGLGFSLLAGLFFSNYPESLSSSAGMQEQGLKKTTILLMWLVLMLSTGLFSALGSIYFAEVSESIFAFTEGVAAGAMLTMIAQTMLPEAYLKGGSIVGMSSLLGFLAALFFKTLE